MGLTMKEKQAVTKQLAVEYKRAGKKEKGKILDTVIELTGYNRSYAARMLRQRVKPKVLSRLKSGGVQITLVEDERTKRKRKQRRRPRKYDKDVFAALRKIWVICAEYLWETIGTLPSQDRPGTGAVGRVKDCR